MSYLAGILLIGTEIKTTGGKCWIFFQVCITLQMIGSDYFPPQIYIYFVKISTNQLDDKLSKIYSKALNYLFMNDQKCIVKYCTTFVKPSNV